MENWVHMTPSILKQGRVGREEPEFAEELEDETKQELIKKQLADKDPYVKRLSSIVEDKSRLNS